MSIMLRNGSGNWSAVDRAEFLSESELQRLLHSSPELIPLQSADVRAVFVREVVMTGSGRVDLLGIASDGSILIVETKLARNDEIRREVIGQVLEYAAHLWDMSFDDLNRLFRDRNNGTDILAALRDVNASADDLELLKDNISENLATGNFILYLIVDAMNPTLEKIVDFVSARVSGVKLHALSLGRYTHNGTEVVIPKHYGGEPPRRPRTGPGGTTSAQAMKSGADAHTASMIDQVLAAWQGPGLVVTMGGVGASIRAQTEDGSHTLFWLLPKRIELLLSSMVRHGAPEELVQQYRARLNDIPSFRHARFQTASKPKIYLKDITEPDLQAFVEASKDIARQWTSVTMSPMS